MADNTPIAQLSSLSTVVDELVARVTALADRYSGTERDDLAHDLYEVERSLKEARRRLAKLMA